MLQLYEVQFYFIRDDKIVQYKDAYMGCVIADPILISETVVACKECNTNSGLCYDSSDPPDNTMDGCVCQPSRSGTNCEVDHCKYSVLISKIE